MTSRGKYIIIEGNDGTGKSTQVEKLAEHLASKGINTKQIHEPAGNPIADAIRTVLKNGELLRDAETNLLLFTAARHELWREARESLEIGTWILSARNYISTLAYQGYAEGLNLQTIKRITAEFTDELYMKPDHTVILALSNSQRRKRIAQRGPLDRPDTFESRNNDFQNKINDGYIHIAHDLNLPIIDASQSIEAIQDEIRAIINQ